MAFSASLRTYATNSQGATAEWHIGARESRDSLFSVDAAVRSEASGALGEARLPHPAKLRFEAVRIHAPDHTRSKLTFPSRWLSLLPAPDAPHHRLPPQSRTTRTLHPWIMNPSTPRRAPNVSAHAPILSAPHLGVAVNFNYGWIAENWIEPGFDFSYPGFDWVKPWPRS